MYALLLIAVRVRGIEYDDEPSSDIFIIIAFALLKAVSAIGIIVWLVLMYTVCCALFQKRELAF